MESKIYTVSEAAMRLKVSKPTVYKLFNEGKLEYFTIGGLRRVTEEQIQKFIKTNEVSKAVKKDIFEDLKDSTK